MRKFAVFSGFLGSGKTSTMVSLADYYEENYKGRAALIVNDLGSPGLADCWFVEHSGCTNSEISGDCICYKNEELMDTLNSLFDEGCELVISDIPGFGVGALEHVYHGLSEKFPGQCELAPFTVLVEPKTVELLRSGFNEDLRYILHTQLLEADLIVLNKIDTISADETIANQRWLEEHYPHAKVICISADGWDNMDLLAKALIEGTASMRKPDIGYGGEDFTRIMEQVCEYNMQYLATVCCASFNGTDYLVALAEEIKKNVAASDSEMPHMKLFAWTTAGDYAKVDMMGSDRPVEIRQPFTDSCTQIAVLLNSSAFGGREKLDEAVSAAVEKVSEEFQLELMIFKKELI